MRRSMPPTCWRKSFRKPCARQRNRRTRASRFETSIWIEVSFLQPLANVVPGFTKRKWIEIGELRTIARSNMAEPTYDELKARLAELEKQQGTRRTGSLEFRVGEKGGVSVYGLGRFPVTLYYEQWIRLLDSADKLREFLEENKSRLKLKA